MRIKKHCITLILLLLGGVYCTAYSQEKMAKFDDDFSTNVAPIGLTYLNPAELDPVSQDEEWTRHVYMKTNVLGLGLAIANVAFEVDLAKHWSFSLPIYYSAWDYFTSTIKFRNFSVQPEFRYWFSKHNDKLFLGAHFGMAYYNLALDSKYRSQDRDGSTPALGGGLSLGYRFPLGKSERWKMELSVGVGYYPLEYDQFLNEPNGKLSHYEKRNYLGVDQVSLSFAYMFNRNKKSK